MDSGRAAWGAFGSNRAGWVAEMNLLQLLDRDLGVNLGGRDFGMAKEFLE
jgi:hypothetical protein